MVQKRKFRILYTLLVVLFAAGIVVVLSYAGSKTHGPIEYLLSKLGSYVKDTEDALILQQRTDKRINKLGWFQLYKLNPDVLKNPPVVLLGAHDNHDVVSFESIVSLEDSLQTTLPLIHIYQAWGSKQEQQFPLNQLKAIVKLGSLPVVTWEPWLTAFNESEYPKLRRLEERDKGGMADVVKGLYDPYIEKWAEEAAKFGMPLFLRLGHEMNDPYRYPWGPHNNTPVEYVNAWKYVHGIFKSKGADNVIWIWSPHPAYGYFDYFYPGDDYVDYVGVGILNFGSIAAWSQWWTFKEIFGTHYEELTSFGKPLMITEFGSLSWGGDKCTWYKEALENLPENYPAVKSILFFHVSEDKTTTLQALNWYVKYDTACTKMIIREIKQWPLSSEVYY